MSYTEAKQEEGEANQEVVEAMQEDVTNDASKLIEQDNGSVDTVNTIGMSDTLDPAEEETKLTEHVDNVKVEEFKSEMKRRKPGTGYEISFEGTQWDEDTYDVEVKQRPAGFFYEANVVVTVDEHSHLASTLVPMSRVVRMGETDITADNFAEIYQSIELPFTMVCQSPVGGGVKRTAVISKLDKEDLVSLLVIYAAVFIDFLASMIVVPMLPFLAEEFGANAAELSFLFSGYSVGSIIGGLIIGWITGKWGTKAGILYSMFGSCAVFLWCGFANGYYSLLAARFVGGLSGNSVPCAMIFIGLRVPQDLKPKYMSYVGVIITSSLMVGPMLGGALSNYGLQVPFFFGSGVAGCGFLATLAGMGGHTPPPKPVGAKVTSSTENKLCYVLSFLYVIPATAMFSMLGQWLIAVYGMTAGDIGNIVSLHGVIVSFNALVVFPQVVKRLGLWGTWACGCTLSIVAFCVMGFTPNWWSFMMVMSPLVGGGYSFMSNTTNPLTDKFTSPYSKSYVMSIATASNSVGFALGPVMWGLWLDYCTETDQLDLFWVMPGVSGFLPLLIMGISYCCIFKPKQLERDLAASKKKAREAEHATKWLETEPTKEDYERLGRLVGAELTKKHWDWTRYTDRVSENMTSYLPHLPTRSVEARMKGVWWTVAQAERSKELWSEYAAENDLDDDCDHDHAQELERLMADVPDRPAQY